jgi:hypothetical protein
VTAYLVRENHRVKYGVLCCKNEKRQKIFRKGFGGGGGHDKQSEKDVRQGQVVKSNGAGQLGHFTDLIDHKKKLGKFLSLTAALQVLNRSHHVVL